MEEDWRNYTPEYNYENKPDKELSIILVSIVIGVLAVVLFTAGYWIKIQLDRHEREQIKKEFIDDMKAATEALKDTTLESITREVEFKPIKKATVQRKPVTKATPRKITDEQWVNEVGTWKSLKSGDLEKMGMKSLKECIKPNSVIDDDVNRCMKGEVARSW
tara:strand:+ start:1257 stop:1742 length:486 start_codon:yes stop_codon:yes gene_type:complete